MGKQNGDIITFLRKKEYIMLNDNLGGGDFGKTVLLKDSYIDELFVAKMYKPRYEEIKEKFYLHFLDEIKILYKLNHPNIVRIYNYYAYEEHCTGYILMEYINGKNIGVFFESYNKADNRKVSIDELFVQLINAFSYMEEHEIAHRDIREGNIMVDVNGVIKIIDFGIGKINTSDENKDDSLMGEINRFNSDTLPQEYYDGIYTSQTDMFYLAELFNRLLNKIKDEELAHFSYQDIVKKMMRKAPKDRYNTFQEIKELIDQQDFIYMPISEQDKKIYQEFTNYIYSSLLSYKMEKKFNYDVNSFLFKLENVIKENMFEDIIQNNSQLISSIVMGGYKCSKVVEIPCNIVKDFSRWFKKSTEDSKKLILRNIINKLSTIGVVFEFDDELPFN